MAHGISTTHPLTAKKLLECGFAEGDVTQSYGSADASAGFHEPSGYVDGEPYSDCFDLHFESVTEKRRDRLVAAGVCVFPRYVPWWTKDHHVHCIDVGLTDDGGECCILSGPRQQIVDFCVAAPPRNGLAGHAQWPAAMEWKPSPVEQHRIAAAYQVWVPDFATKVFGPAGNWLPCYAWFEAALGQVTCEVRALVEGLGWTVGDATEATTTIVAPAETHDPPAIVPSYRAADFNRAKVRDVATALGLDCDFEPNDYYAIVRLS